jgi:hypothetical protein
VINTLDDDGDIHPDELVTVKVYVPGGITEIIVEVPFPVVVTPPGERVIVQSPVEGNPLNGTLPVEAKQVGCVIVPAIGAVGVGLTVTVVDAEADGPLHPFAVTLTVAVPEKAAAHVTVPVVPVPEIELPVPVTDQL